MTHPKRLLPAGLACAVLLLGGCQGERQGQHYLVFFEQLSSQLDDSAKGTIQTAALQARATKGPVSVIGYADPEGSPQANRDLSARRARMVEDGLVADGVSPERISRAAVGSVGYAADSIEARRVEIVVWE